MPFGNRENLNFPFPVRQLLDEQKECIGLTGIGLAMDRNTTSIVASASIAIDIPIALAPEGFYLCLGSLPSHPQRLTSPQANLGAGQLCQ
jgi:hypothetical protein